MFYFCLIGGKYVCVGVWVCVCARACLSVYVIPVTLQTDAVFLSNDTYWYYICYLNF